MSKDIRNDLTVAGIFVLLSVAVIIGTSDYPTSDRAVGIRTFPLILALLLGGLSVFLIVRSLLASRRLRQKEEQGSPVLEKQTVIRILVTAGAVAIYVVVVNIGGFIITSALYLAAMAYFFGERRLWVVTTYAVVGVFAVYLLFGVVARVPFPEGPAEHLLNAIGLG